MILIDDYFEIDKGAFVDFTPRIKELSLAGLGCGGDDGELVFTGLPQGLERSESLIGISGTAEEAGVFLVQVEVVGNDCSNPYVVASWELTLVVRDGGTLADGCDSDRRVEAIYLKNVEEFYGTEPQPTYMADLSVWNTPQDFADAEYTEDLRRDGGEPFMSWQLTFALPGGTEMQLRWLEGMERSKNLGVIVRHTDGGHTAAGVLSVKEKAQMSVKRQNTDKGAKWVVQVNGDAYRSVKVTV